MRDINFHVGMSLCDFFHPLRRGDQRKQFYARISALFDKVDRRRCAAARGERGIHDDNLPVLRILGEFAVVFHGAERLFVPVQSDMSDARLREKLR